MKKLSSENITKNHFYTVQITFYFMSVLTLYIVFHVPTLYAFNMRIADSVGRRIQYMKDDSPGSVEDNTRNLLGKICNLRNI